MQMQYRIGTYRELGNLLCNLLLQSLPSSHPRVLDVLLDTSDVTPAGIVRA